MGTNTYPLVPLENLSEIHDSRRIPVKKSDRKPGPYPYYGASGIVDYVDSYIFDGEFLLLAEDGENLRSQNLPIAFLAKGKFWVNNHAHVLQGKKGNNTRFLCYAIQVADIRSYLSGSTRPKLTQTDMKRILVPAPEPREQRAIAHILGTLDDKIELNRQMNRTLEAMAQALFKSWFIDFDPVVVNALRAGNPIPENFAERAAHYRDNPDALRLPEDTLRQFPDRFQDSELGPIPEGWEIKAIGDFVKRLPVGKKYNQKTVAPTGRIPVLDQGKSGIIGYHNNEPSVEASSDNPVAVFANHTCYMRLISFPFSTIQNVIPFVGRDVDTIWAFFATYGKQNFTEYKGHWPDFVLHKVTVPHERFSHFYAKQVQPLLKNIWRSESEISVLAKLRDTLLPKLISGELRVPDAEKLLEDAL